MKHTLPEQVAFLADYLKRKERQRNSERNATRRQIAELVSRVDDLEAALTVAQERLNELE